MPTDRLTVLKRVEYLSARYDVNARAVATGTYFAQRMLREKGKVLSATTILAELEKHSKTVPEYHGFPSVVDLYVKAIIFTRTKPL